MAQLKITGMKAIKTKIREIERRMAQAAQEGRSVGIHTSAQVYEDSGAHPGIVALTHEDSERRFFNPALKHSKSEVLDTLADGLHPDGRGAKEAMEDAGQLLKKRIQEAITDEPLVKSGHLKAQVTSVPYREKKQEG